MKIENFIRKNPNICERSRADLQKLRTMIQNTRSNNPTVTQKDNGSRLIQENRLSKQKICCPA